MSTLDLQEQEQVAALKGWWQEHGNLVLTGVTLVLLVLAAFNGWRWYQNSQTAQAAGLYDVLLRAAADRDTKKVRDAAGTMIADFPRTSFAPLAALVSAKVQFQAGDSKTARQQLQWVVDNARDPELQAIARLRLANVMVDEKAYDDALKLLDAKFGEEFAALVAGLRADIFVLQGKTSDARAAYRAAIDAINKKPEAERDAALKDRLQIKLDALGETG